METLTPAFSIQLTRTEHAISPSGTHLRSLGNVLTTTSANLQPPVARYAANDRSEAVVSENPKNSQRTAAVPVNTTPFIVPLYMAAVCTVLLRDRAKLNIEPFDCDPD